MKLEFLENGSPDCPLIRLYEFDLAEAARLREIFRSLSSGVGESIALHGQPDVTPIAACHLTLRLGPKDVGIIRRDSSTFDCVFTASARTDIAALVEPFCEVGQPGRYQWLTEKGDVSLLLSFDGSW